MLNLVLSTVDKFQVYTLPSDLRKKAERYYQHVGGTLASNGGLISFIRHQYSNYDEITDRYGVNVPAPERPEYYRLVKRHVNQIIEETLHDHSNIA